MCTIGSEDWKRTTYSFSSEPYKRPKRTCPYCEKGFDRLRRHIERMHQDQDAVQDMQDAPVREQREIASSLRKQGILCQNRKALGKEDHVLTGERKDVKDLVHCSMCKAIQVEKIFKSNDKFREVITGIQNDEIGQLAKRDQIIRMISERIFKQTTKKVDKEMMSRHSVMGNMRLLARLLLTLRDQPEMSDDANAEQIFSRQTFYSLETAIIGLTSNSNSHDIKYGLKYKLLYLLKTGAGIVKTFYRSQMKDKEAQEIDYFLEMLQHHQSSIFGDAEYQITKARQEKSRIPEEETIEEDVEKLREYLVKQISTDQFSFPDVSSYVALRDAVCARITLFNARRGNEASHLTLQQWRDAESSQWTQRTRLDQLDPVDRALVKTSLLTFMPGKGRSRQVPVHISKDCVPAMRMIADPTIRQGMGILGEDANKYVFANTGGSVFHVNGWQCINNVALQAGLRRPDLITATKQRHRISTEFADREMPPQERELFYDHMGHCADVNKGSYQHPLAVQQILSVGRRLHEIDGKIVITYGFGNSCYEIFLAPNTCQDCQPSTSTSKEIPSTSTSKEIPSTSTSEEIPSTFTSEEIPSTFTSEEMETSIGMKLDLFSFDFHA
ncbi:hypothetical protein CAPTEDRAFT_193407 [Capitella teleta]|uniref:Uncharacterized protein n=1 Tax=Capitella teleta TaxID=283909 RepID=R7U2Q2_CAPTE|nr:hypothetical protein CAPTEDRAFT_193407 [Capitella teleta]|eukprot:ELT97450.1 hypothetical protein CAPTEDRAFT_193407 [Capitella teleta]